MCLRLNISVDKMQVSYFSAKPFLEMASLRDEPITACPSSGANESMLTSVSNHSESSTLFEDGGHGSMIF